MSKLLTWLEGTVSSGGAVDVEGRGDVLAAGRSSSGVVMVVGGDSLSFLGPAAPPATGGGLLLSGTLVEEEEWDSPCPHCLMYPHQVDSCLCQVQAWWWCLVLRHSLC